MEWRISNASLVSEEKLEKLCSLSIKDGLLYKLPEQREDTEKTDLKEVNAHGFFVFPGLINAHDSLLATYQCFRGTNHPYHNWLAWDNEIKASPLFRKRMLLDPAELYQLGSYKNIFSGVSTVVDHIPHHVRLPFAKQCLPHLLKDFGIAHSMCSYALQWGEGIRQEYAYAQENNVAFIIHIAEGFDDESKLSLQRLKEMGALGEHTVLVHGLSLSPYDLDDIAESKAHIVWCPASNLHIYHKTAPIKEILERGINLCLGSDASMYGSPHILHDLRTASEYYQEMYEESLKAEQILRMLHSNPKKAFRIECAQSTYPWDEASTADFFVLRGKYPDDPCRSLCEAKLEDIYLVVCDGKPMYGRKEMEAAFSAYAAEEIERFFCKTDGQERIVIRKQEAQSSIHQIMAKAKAEHSLSFMPIRIG